MSQVINLPLKNEETENLPILRCHNVRHQGPFSISVLERA